MTPEEVLQSHRALPRISPAAIRSITSTVRWTSADVYFVANPHPYELTATCSFRVTGKTARVLVAAVGTHGTCRRVPRRKWRDSRRRAAEAAGSVFVVFRKPREPGRSDRRAHAQTASRWYPPRRSALPMSHVTRARYGVLDDPQRTRDVTEKVQRNVDKGKYRFPVTSIAEGDDPAVGAVKTLIVDYTIDGKPFTAKARMEA